MAMLNKLRLRLRALFFKSKMEDELQAELQFHLEREIEENIARGMTPEEARYAAIRSFGGVERVKEESRDVRGVRLLEEVWQDLRYGARMLLKKPGFTLIAVFTLALGIGVNTTIFSFTNALLLRPLPGIAEPERLVQIGRTAKDNPFGTLAYPDYLDYREQNTTLDGIAIYSGTTLHLSTGQEAERVKGTLVSGNYFEVLGARAAQGRLLAPADAQTEGAQPVAVISASLWRRRFGADPNIVEKTVSLNSHGYTIIGVASDGFAGAKIGEKIDVWIPITMAQYADPGLARLDGKQFRFRGLVWLWAFGRLKLGVTAEHAGADLSNIARRLAEVHTQTNKDRGVALVAGVGLRPDDKKPARNFTQFLLIAVGIVLLIACANVAGLLLARASSRRKEISIRLALGAGRLRVIRQLLTESLMLSLCGALLGLLIAAWLCAWLQRWLPERYLGMPLAVDLNLDVRVLGFTFALALLTGVLFGLMPALQLSKPDLVADLKEQRITGRGAGLARMSSALVVVQAALSLVLLVGAGLCLRTLHNARAINFGFDTERVLTARLDLGRQSYAESQGQLFYQQLLERAQALPGVQQASLALSVPLNGADYGTGIKLEGRAEQISLLYNIVTSHYFGTMGIPLLLGRDFSPHDDVQAPRVAIVNESLARQLWPNENPIGKRFTVQKRSYDNLPVEVIGLTRDIAGYGPFAPMPAQLYLPLPQCYGTEMTLHLRTKGKPEQLIAALQQTIRELDKNLPVYEVRTLAWQLDNSLTPQRMAALLISGFGLLAMALAAIGLYGVMSYAVAERTQELGIRMALGAQTGDVLVLVMKQGCKLAVIGALIGLGGAWAVTRSIKTLLYGVSATDPLTFVLTGAALMLVALLACWIPARRATKVDPLVTLRYE